jgi:uncharacterized Tic20 family protein
VGLSGYRRAYFFGLSKIVFGHPVLTWVLNALTLICFGFDAWLSKVTSDPLQARDFFVALGLYGFVALLGPVLIWLLNRVPDEITAANRIRAAHRTVAAQLIWLAAVCIVWAMTGVSLFDGAHSAVHGILAALILMPSFALNLIFMQRGLRDFGYDRNINSGEQNRHPNSWGANPKVR